jgi:hypothetical protein
MNKSMNYHILIANFFLILIAFIRFMYFLSYNIQIGEYEIYLLIGLIIVLFLHIFFLIKKMKWYYQFLIIMNIVGIVQGVFQYTTVYLITVNAFFAYIMIAASVFVLNELKNKKKFKFPFF